ncbi:MULTISPECIES: hypothetical protein [unclassified Burkholderia]|uniref:hypothetical protein n=1 Tax=unclassified Burkholderia TaxID=2613784 RepID=UPI000F58686E|nr:MULTISPECIES: hypothetical protein [unclassified Burkholderia]
MARYVKSAPKALINLYERTSALKGRALLERLITHSGMESAWGTLETQAKQPGRDTKPYRAVVIRPAWDARGVREKQPGHATKLFREIVVIEQVSRKPPGKSRLEEKETYRRIAELTQRLVSAIANGPLDKLVYEFFSAEAMDTNGITGWEDLNEVERAECAHTQLLEWPPVVDILDKLRIQAANLAEEAMSKPRIVDRVPRRPEDFRKLHFVRELSTFIASEYGRPLHSAVANITNAILDTCLIDADVAKIVNTNKDC